MRTLSRLTHGRVNFDELMCCAWLAGLLWLATHGNLVIRLVRALVN